MARPHRSDPRGADGDDALLRPDGRRCGAPAERVADPGPPDGARRNSRSLSGLHGSSARLPGAWLVVVLALASAAPATAQPRVRLIATGGTIANSAQALGIMSREEMQALLVPERLTQPVRLVA